MNEERRASPQCSSSAVFIQDSSGEARAPGNCQWSGPRKVTLSSVGERKGEMEGSNYPAGDVWEFYCWIIIPQRHAKLFPKLLRDTPAGERSPGPGRDRGRERDETCEGAHGPHKRSRVLRPGITKRWGEKKKKKGREKSNHASGGRTMSATGYHLATAGMDRPGMASAQANVGFGGKYFTFRG